MSRRSSATITTRPIPLTFFSGAIPGPLRGVVLGLSCGVVLDGPIRGPRAIFTALRPFSVPRRSDGLVRRGAPGDAIALHIQDLESHSGHSPTRLERLRTTTASALCSRPER
jgi:hypothetical protein